MLLPKSASPQPVFLLSHTFLSLGSPHVAFSFRDLTSYFLLKVLDLVNTEGKLNPSEEPQSSVAIPAQMQELQLSGRWASVSSTCARRMNA